VTKKKFADRTRFDFGFNLPGAKAKKSKAKKGKAAKGKPKGGGS